MSNALAWIVCVTAVCAAITTIANAFFSQERKMFKLKHQHDESKAAAYSVLTDEQAKAMTADRGAAKAEAEKELYKMRRY